MEKKIVYNKERGIKGCIADGAVWGVRFVFVNKPMGDNSFLM